MGLFLSTTINKIDKKGRISVPAPFRSYLAEENFQGVVLFQSYTQSAIEGVPMSVMDQMNNRIDSNFDMFSDNHDELSTVLFGDATPLAFDGDGRITLPQGYIDFAGLGDSAAFVGMGHKFQIWNPDKLKIRKEKALKAVRSKKITLPPESRQGDNG